MTDFLGAGEVLEVVETQAHLDFKSSRKRAPKESSIPRAVVSPATIPDANLQALPRREVHQEGGFQLSNDIPARVETALKIRCSTPAMLPKNNLSNDGDCAPHAGDAHRTTGAVPEQFQAQATFEIQCTVGLKDDGKVFQAGRDTQKGGENLAIVAIWRKKRDLDRAAQRLNLQCQALCRRYVGGDVEQAGKLWQKVQRGAVGAADVDIAELCLPYMLGIEPLKKASRQCDRVLDKLGRAHPLWGAFARDIPGFGAVSLCGFIGEANHPIAAYRSVSALWKRFGLAVIDGKRQRKVEGEAAIIHGYVPERRAFGWNVAETLFKAQGKDESALKYRRIYDVRKAAMLERGATPMHAHNDAKRIMLKALLKGLWCAARALERKEG